MRKKANIYDSDAAENSKRLHFSQEEKAARAEQKAEMLGEKLGKAQDKLPKKAKPRLHRDFDSKTGKRQTRLTLDHEVKPRSRGSLAGKAASRALFAADMAAHSKLRQVEHENVGTEAAHKTEFTAEQTATRAVGGLYRHAKDTPFRRVEKLEKKAQKAAVNAKYQAALRDHPELQRKSMSSFFQKQRIKRAYAKELRKAQRGAGYTAQTAKKFKDAVSGAGQVIVEAVKGHKAVLVGVGLLGLLLVMLMSSMSSCAAGVQGGIGAILGTSYTAEDSDVVQTDTNYTQLETALQNQLANIERTYPGYDEYRYDVDTIGHDPNELISYLTAKFDSFTPAQVQAELQAIFDQQYTLTVREVVEIRYRTESWTDEDGNEHEYEVAYEYYILYVTLRNKSLATVADSNLTEEQKKRYEVILAQKGNKPYLFGDNIYANPSPGETYQIPTEAMADPEFAALITEAEQYLGYPYVWGGSTPQTSFDCSGFVCWVFSNSGVYDLPRTTATGIYNQSARISASDARPGDVVFFTGTYDCAGPVSHVGIYVGNGMMIHCGSPIKYANLNADYWQQHLYAFGRLS